MELIIPEQAAEKLLFLSAEDEEPPETLLARLIEDEDRRRHVERPPFEGEVRFKCGRGLCFEERRRPDARDLIEL